MSSEPKYAKYTFDWKVQWSDFDRIGKESFEPRHYFVTSFKNVSLRWYIALEGHRPNIGLFIYYEDGPLEKIKGIGYEVGVVKRDGSLHPTRDAGIYEYPRGSDCPGWGWRKFEDKDSTAVRRKYGLKESDSLTYQITIKIPTKTFAFCIPSPIPAPCSPWLVKLFESINSADGDLLPPDTKVAGRDGIVFNCHNAIVAAQSKALKIIFQHPPSEEGFGEAAPEDEQIGPNPKKRKASAMDDEDSTAIGDSVYDFPNLSEGSLKSILEYLYKGKVTTANLSVTELIEIGDAGEQYDLKPLKEFSAAELWKRVVIEDPACAFEIARFAEVVYRDC